MITVYKGLNPFICSCSNYIKHECDLGTIFSTSVCFPVALMHLLVMLTQVLVHACLGQYGCWEGSY